MYQLMKYISRTHRCAGIFRSAQLKDPELRPGQHIYIYHICKSPGITQDELVRLICVNKSNVTRHLNALEQAGFITRVPSQRDRRLHIVRPTQKALDIYPKVRSVMQNWARLLTEDFSDHEKSQRSQMLERVYDKAVSIISAQAGEEKE